MIGLSIIDRNFVQSYLLFKFFVLSLKYVKLFVRTTQTLKNFTTNCNFKHQLSSIFFQHRTFFFLTDKDELQRSAVRVHQQEIYKTFVNIYQTYNTKQCKQYKQYKTYNTKQILNLFVRKTKNISNVVHETGKRNFCKHEKFSARELLITLILFFVFTVRDSMPLEQFRLKSMINLTFGFPTTSSKPSSKDFITRF